MARFSAKPFTRPDFISVGRLWGSSQVALEAEGAENRWTRDLVILTDYGHGADELETFKALKRQHATLVAERPGSVADKRNVVAAKSAGYKLASDWLDKTTCSLKKVAKLDPKFQMRVYESQPNDDNDELPKHLASHKLLLLEAKALAPNNATLDARLAEVDAIIEAVMVAPAKADAANETKVADTAELDYLDGQLIVAMRELNEAGTKAIRNGSLNARLSEYRFNYLRRSRPISAKDEDSTPTPANENESA